MIYRTLYPRASSGWRKMKSWPGMSNALRGGSRCLPAAGCKPGWERKKRALKGSTALGGGQPPPALWECRSKYPISFASQSSGDVGTCFPSPKAISTFRSLHPVECKWLGPPLHSLTLRDKVPNLFWGARG